MDVGNVFSEALALYRRHWKHFIAIAVVVYLIISLIGLLAAMLGTVGLIVAAVVSFVGAFWLQGALVEAVADVRDGRADLSIGETFGRVAPRIGAIVGASLLAGVGIMIGLLLLVIPGLVLMTLWSMVIPAVVVERTGVLASFGRSRELVRGNGWPVFGVIVTTMLLLVLASIILSIALLALLPDELAEYLADVISGTIFAPLMALALTVAYFQLRERAPATETRDDLAAADPR
ncbi:MAG: hypothetical protein M3M94_03765 [Actinomycetota bacterium]|nr:hypothetical protein [Actinomycetota bacterium]